MCPCVWEDLVADRVPVARLDAFFERRLASDPEDGLAHLALARVHLDAFALRTADRPTAAASTPGIGRLVQARAERASSLVAGRSGRLDARCAEGADLGCERVTEVEVPCCGPSVAADPREEHWRRLVSGGVAILGWCPSACLDAAAIGHAIEARRHFVEARRLRPSDPLPRLGLAVLDAQLHGALVRQPGARIPGLEESSLGAALDAFAQARALARSALVTFAASGEGHRTSADFAQARRVSEIGLEAARWIVEIDQLARVLRQLDDDGDPTWPAVRGLRIPPSVLAETQVTLRELDSRVEETRELLMMSPLVLHLDATATWADIDAPDHTVVFDLDGGAAPERWSWVRPEAGFLVWDPEATGRVRSGRQLFGEVTWWVLFDDGYAALSTLDEDGDGRVAGDELDGTRLWFDRDGDGVSAPGEVDELRDHGIVALVPSGSRDAAGHLVNPAGAELADGTTRPTFDWMGTRR